MRIVLRYVKYGMVRFVSARDTVRAIERNLRRARVPMIFTKGFHPHPIMSFLDSTPVGVVNRALYFSLEVENWNDETFERLKKTSVRGLQPCEYWITDADINSMVDAYEYSIFLEKRAVDISRLHPNIRVKKGRKGKEYQLGELVEDLTVTDLKNFFLVKYTSKRERIFSPWEIVNVVKVSDGIFLPVLEEVLHEGRRLREILEG